MSHRKRGPRRKHVPQRTCIACRQVGGKRALIRLVRTDEGVQVDATGKLAGRGAYLHPYQTCWKAVLKGNRLESALRTGLTSENRAALLAFMATLPPDAAAAEAEAPSAQDDEQD
ncbi:MAG: YlxR family protein [Caldilineaceae bacterium]